LIGQSGTQLSRLKRVDRESRLGSGLGLAYQTITMVALYVGLPARTATTIRRCRRKRERSPEGGV